QDGPASPGLKGVVVADTALGDVRGTEGFYHYRQYAAPDLAAKRSFEDVWHLLVDGALPTREEAPRFLDETAPRRMLPDAMAQPLPAIARSGDTPLAGLRTAVSHLAAVEAMPPTYDAEPHTIRANTLRLSAAVPVIIAALHRFSKGDEAVAPRSDLPFAANYL